MKVKNLTIRGRTFWFDREVPRDLRTALDRSRWKFSLRTDSLRMAEQLAMNHNNKIDDLVKAYRHIGIDNLIELAKTLKEHGLDFPDGMANAPSLASVVEQLSELMKGHDEDRRPLLEAIKAKAMTESISGWAELLGTDQAARLFTHSYTNFTDNVLEIEKAPLVAAKRAVRRVSKSSGPKAHYVADGTLSGLIAVWEREASPVRATVTDFTAAVTRFEEMNGPLKVEDIKRTHVAAFRNALFDMPARLSMYEREKTFPEILAKFAGTDIQRISVGTVRKQFGAVRTLLNVAVDSGIIEVSPAAGLAIKKQKKEKAKRLAFNEDQLSAIANTAKEATGDIPWMMKLAIATGARSGELLALTTDDVHKKGKLVYITVTDDTEGTKSIKTESSRRDIPIHSDIAKDFLAYVKTRKGRLFDTKADVYGKVSGIFSKRANRWLRKTCGIDDTRLTWHSFRHSFKSLCRTASVPEEIHDRLTGHASTTVGRSYGGYDIETLSEAINKIRLPQGL